MNILRRLALAVFFFAAVYGVSFFARKQTAHFTISRILSTLPFHPEWECENPPEVDQILSQPYHFFAAGGQSWVFLSEDGEWIVKFFDFRPTWNDVAKTLHLPSFLCPSLTTRQVERREKPIEGYALASKRMREICGLTGVFLNGKKTGEHHLTITDKIHCPHLVDLSSCSFVIQRRAEVLPSRLAKFLKEGKTREANQVLSSALNLIAERTSLGVGDGDNVRLHLNLGFIGDKAVYLDAGTFFDAPQFLTAANAEEEIVRSANVLIEKLSNEKTH